MPFNLLSTISLSVLYHPKALIVEIYYNHEFCYFLLRQIFRFIVYYLLIVMEFLPVLDPLDKPNEGIW